MPIVRYSVYLTTWSTCILMTEQASQRATFTSLHPFTSLSRLDIHPVFPGRVSISQRAAGTAGANPRRQEKAAQAEGGNPGRLGAGAGAGAGAGSAAGADVCLGTGEDACAGT